MRQPPEEVRSWCEVDASALAANIAVLRSRLHRGALLGAVVKSNAYGHGLALCARPFLQAGADWLVVNDVEEAESLRRAGIEAPVYLCALLPPSQAGRAASTGARVVLCQEEVAVALDQAGRQRGTRVKVHIKVETGTHRQGATPQEAVELALKIEKLEGLVLEGLTTHYADIEDTTEHSFARRQRELLEEVARALAGRGIQVPMLHSANSAATLLWPETHAALVRAGIAAYGLWPSRETFATALQRSAWESGQSPPQLRPALSWRARIAQVKEVPSGGYIGYGRTFRAAYPMRIAVLPVGYYEGYDRRLSNVAHVLIDGQRAPVRGRVCMNMIMVEVTHIPGVRSGGVATLLGTDGEESVSAEQWAAWMGTIHYEVVARIHPEQPRFLRRADQSLEREERF